MYKKTVYNIILIVSVCLTNLLGCTSSLQMSKIPATAEPSEEVSKLEADIKNAIARNVDILAADDFQESQSYLAKTRRAIGDNEPQKRVINFLRTSRAYLERAYVLAQNRQGNAEDLLSSRQMTLMAGAANHSQLQGDLKDLDSEVGSIANSLSETSIEKLDDFQQRYVEIEKRAVVLNRLAKELAMVNGAKKDDTIAKIRIRARSVLEQARKQFLKSEAEAYQQGENLVIRLKKINFATGRSDLPEESLHLLSKVSEVAKSIKATHIIVEGHTDAVGWASENQQISEMRAKTVAKFFKTNGLGGVDIKAEGHGFRRPISTNKSSQGESQNSRVDVIITPEAINQ